MSVKEALYKKKVKDHLGNEFESKSKMYSHYGLSRQTAEARLKNGWSLEKTLTYKTRKGK